MVWGRKHQQLKQTETDDSSFLLEGLHGVNYRDFCHWGWRLLMGPSFLQTLTAISIFTGHYRIRLIIYYLWAAMGSIHFHAECKSLADFSDLIIFLSTYDWLLLIFFSFESLFIHFFSWMTKMVQKRKSQTPAWFGNSFVVILCRIYIKSCKSAWVGLLQ